MSYLLLSICTTSLIFILFKLFSKYIIDTAQAITVNYYVACICGILSAPMIPSFESITQYTWFFGAIAMGAFFILIFNLMALTTQKNGVSVAAVASKMSIAIPVLIGIWLYKEDTNFLKITGIGIALIAVYLTATKPSTTAFQKKNLIFPILVFIGSGIIDASLKYFENQHVAPQDTSLFSAIIFGAAASIGTLILGYKYYKGTTKITLRDSIAGIALGVPNYYSIYFLLQALRSERMDSATVFTINNVCVLLVSTLAGVFFFKEKLYTKNTIGIGLAILSIIIITFSIQ